MLENILNFERGELTAEVKDMKFFDLTPLVRRAVWNADRASEFKSGIVFIKLDSQDSFVFMQEAGKGVEPDWMKISPGIASRNGHKSYLSQPLAVPVDNSTMDLGQYQQIIGGGKGDYLEEVHLSFSPVLARKKLEIDTGDHNNLVYSDGNGDYDSRQSVRVFDFTPDFEEFVESIDMKAGSSYYAYVGALHTTCAFVIGDEGQAKTFTDGLNSLVPPNPNYEHNIHHGLYTLDEPPNAEAHLKQMLLGSGIEIPLVGRQADLGANKELWLVELDGPRELRNASLVLYSLDEAQHQLIFE